VLAALELLTTSCAVAGKTNQAVLEAVYGRDDRADFYAIEEASLRFAARSVGALVPLAAIASGSTETTRRLLGTRFDKAYGLCPGERFATQPTVADCSGFLGAPDLFVTAGHCVPDSAACASSVVVFDFRYDTARSDPLTVKKDNLYRCAEIVARRQDERGDYALLRLSRAVSGRKPLRLRRAGDVAVGDRIAALGHPMGLPFKSTPNGRVRKAGDGPYFTAALDTFAGNSGSPILDQASGSVVGILVGGEDDLRSAGGCKVVKRCAEDECAGEDVLRAAVFAAAVPATPEPEPAVVTKIASVVDAANRRLDACTLALAPASIVSSKAAGFHDVSIYAQTDDAKPPVGLVVSVDDHASVAAEAAILVDSATRSDAGFGCRRAPSFDTSEKRASHQAQRIATALTARLRHCRLDAGPAEALEARVFHFDLTARYDDHVVETSRAAAILDEDVLTRVRHFLTLIPAQAFRRCEVAD
jgi:hypothetical protein